MVGLIPGEIILKPSGLGFEKVCVQRKLAARKSHRLPLRCVPLWGLRFGGECTGLVLGNV